MKWLYIMASMLALGMLAVLGGQSAGALKGVGETRDPVAMDPVVATASSAIARTVRVTTCAESDPDSPCVQSRGQTGYVGVGSGVIYAIDGSTAFVVTNSHVIARANHVFVAMADASAGEFLDSGIEAKVVGSDPLSEVALISFPLAGIPLWPEPAKAASPIDLQVGQRVVAVGNPLDLGLTVSSGIISKLGRRANLGLKISHLIQTDTPLNPGNSGGGLWSLDGRVAGINTAILGKNNIGMGFAIPAEYAFELADAMRASPTGHVTHGAIGAYLLMTHEGLLVKQLSLLCDDRIAYGDKILAVQGQPVRNLEQVHRLIDRCAPGRNLSLKLERGGKVLILNDVLVTGVEEGAASDRAP